MITTKIQIDRQKAQTDRILFRQTATTDYYSSTTDYYSPTTDHYSLETDHYSPTCMNSFQTDPLQSKQIQKDILKDILTEYYSHANRLLLFKIDFYYSRFYRQINLSPLYLTQVTFEDLPWFTLSINRQTSKTEDRSKK